MRSGHTVWRETARFQRSAWVATTLALGMIGCGGGTEPPPTPPPVAQVIVSPANLELITGQSGNLSVEIRDATGKPLSGRAVAWASSDQAVATVSQQGVVTAVAAGTATVNATSEGKSGSAQVAVSPPPVATVLVTPTTLTVQVGQGGTFTAEARDANSSAIPSKAFTWQSSAPAVATVSPAGVVTTFAPGTATITASVEGKSGSAFLNVTPGPVQTVTVSPAASNLQVGQKVQLAASAKDALGFLVTGHAVTWTSSAPQAASVSATGEVTALAAGLATITATIDGQPGIASVAVTSSPLEIHQVDVGWGSAVLVRGPDGTTVLLEAGNTGHGTADVVPYLGSIGLTPATGLSYTIAGHQHCDHIGGLDEVIQAGYNVKVHNYYNGSTYSTSCGDQWSASAATTTAGALTIPLVGSTISLGYGARLTFLAVNGAIIGGGQLAVSDENDRSIAVLIQYGGFDYLWASDLGGGDTDNACTGRSTDQKDVETAVIRAISPGGAAPLITAGGIDVLYVNHHGSESSTNPTYMNLARPQVALISTGAGQTTGWDFPRKDVLENVLLAQAGCVTAPPAVVFQNEEGAPIGAETSFSGLSVGDITVTTSGLTTFTVSATGRVSQGPVEVAAAGLPRSFSIDDLPAPSPVVLAEHRGSRRIRQ